MKHIAFCAFFGVVFGAILSAQAIPTTPASPVNPVSPASPQAPADPSATSSVSEAPGLQAPTASGFLAGTWVVDRAIYDFITVLKDVKDLEGTYYKRLTFSAQGKGTISYAGKAELVEMEYDMREQGLTIAYGSRLKPQTDLFQLLYLADGKLFLKSRRLGTMNGTMYYILTKEK